MIKKRPDIRKIKVISSNKSLRLIHLLEKNKIMQGVVNKHFYNYNMLSSAGIKAFFSRTGVEKHLSRIYENFYQKKLDSEYHYYKSRPTMTHKLLKNLLNNDSQKPIEREVKIIQKETAANLSEDDLAMITQTVLSAISRERLREERRKGK